jgi:hypothetical protein
LRALLKLRASQRGVVGGMIAQPVCVNQCGLGHDRSQQRFVGSVQAQDVDLAHLHARLFEHMHRGPGRLSHARL